MDRTRAAVHRSGGDPTFNLTHHLTDRYGNEIRTATDCEVVPRFTPPTPADPMEGCGMVDDQLVCGAAEDVQQTAQDAVVNSDVYAMVNWLSFRSWGNSGATFLGGDVIAGKDYSMDGCDYEAGNGCVGWMESGAESGLKAAGQTGAQEVMQKSFGKVLGAPLGVVRHGHRLFGEPRDG